MKSKLNLRVSAAAFFVIVSIGLAGAQINPATGSAATPAFDPATGALIPPEPSWKAGASVRTFDPTTGLPISPESSWKDPGWQDPDLVLTNVDYQGLQLSEIARSLREVFKEQFDILLPGSSAGNLMAGADNGAAQAVMDWGSTSITLRLKNVKASELFNAMNLLFENDGTPLRWELKENGNRPTALLRVLSWVAVSPSPGMPEPARKIYFVGDLVGDEKSGGMSMEQIVKTVTDVWEMTGSTNGGHIQFHKEAQLLVVTGSPSQVDFMEQTLNALRQKVTLARRAQTKNDDLKPKPDAAKPATSDK